MASTWTGHALPQGGRGGCAVPARPCRCSRPPRNPLPPRGVSPCSIAAAPRPSQVPFPPAPWLQSNGCRRFLQINACAHTREGGTGGFQNAPSPGTEGWASSKMFTNQSGISGWGGLNYIPLLMRFGGSSGGLASLAPVCTVSPSGISAQYSLALRLRPCSRSDAPVCDIPS